MLEDDQRLVAAILSGESGRFAELVVRFTPGIRQIVGRSVRDGGLRDELVQTTFLLAFRALRKLEAPDRLEAWLARIARNAVSDELERRSRRERREVPLDGIDPADDVRERAGWIWDEVARLGAEAALVLALRYRDGLSYGEIAARLQVRTSTVRGRIYEARRALRRRLDRLDRPAEETET